MFIGHFGVGLAAKPLAPKVSLGTLFLAAQLVDLLWPTLLLLGFERVRIAPDAGGVPLELVYYPWSHSLLAVIVWGVMLGLTYRLLRNDSRGAIVLGAAVVSHWLLDVIVHRPDLPLYPGSNERLGLDLWMSLPASLALELAIYAAGAWLYLRSTEPLDALGRWAAWSLLALLLAIHLGNVFGPPPPSVSAIAWVGQAQWLIVAWGYWIDRHRRPIAVSPHSSAMAQV